MTLHNGVIASYTYNKAGWLTDLVYEITGSTSTTLANYSYTYDNVGNRTVMNDEYGTHNYTYDDLYRLSDATHPQGYNPAEAYDYDDVGNRLYSGGTFSNVYNAANRLVEDNNFIYSYDENGNTISKEEKTSGAYSQFTWNAENQLQLIEEYTNIASATPISVSSYTYDGMGRRVAKEVNGVVTKYIYDNEDILFELDENDTVIARYTHGPGIDEPISVERDTDLDGILDTTYYYVADGLGSIVKLIDASGAVVNSYVYDSFGNMVDVSETVPNFYTYTGREFDSESGLYYYRARYYDASIGRFISEDPIGFEGGINFYSYVGNRSVIFIDPFGFDVIGPIWGTPGLGPNPASVPYNSNGWYWFGFPMRQTHANRNKYNRCPKKEPKGCTWYKLDRVFNKYRAPDGSECAYDKDGNLLQDRNGNYTYNFYPHNNSLNFHPSHLLKDVLPHFYYGRGDAYTPNLTQPPE